MPEKIPYCVHEGNKYIFVAYDHNTMQSLFINFQTEGHLLLSTLSNPYVSYLKISKKTQFCWTMKYQTHSKTSLSMNLSIANVFHQKNIESILWNVRFIFSRITSSLVYAQMIQISLYNYGTNSYIRLKTPSTCSVPIINTQILVLT